MEIDNELGFLVFISFIIAMIILVSVLVFTEPHKDSEFRTYGKIYDSEVVFTLFLNEPQSINPDIRDQVNEIITEIVLEAQSRGNIELENIKTEIVRDINNTNFEKDIKVKNIKIMFY